MKEGRIRRSDGIRLLDGTTRIRYGETCSILRSAGVYTRKIHNISSVGKTMCFLLVMKIYKDKLVNILVSEGSPLRFVTNFDPLLEEHLNGFVTAG